MCLSKLEVDDRDVCLFFFNDTATTEIYTLSLHDALPISTRVATSTSTPVRRWRRRTSPGSRRSCPVSTRTGRRCRSSRSEEHTSELQSRQYLVCRLLLEKKKGNRRHLFHAVLEKDPQNHY